MKTKFYLVVSANGKVRTAKTQPNLVWNEVSIAMNLEMPDMLFKKPSLQASIVVPNDAATPKEIALDVQEQIKEAIQERVGMEVKLTLVPQEEV